MHNLSLFAKLTPFCLGMLRYTLLVGKPPFETPCLKDTYIRIKKNEYTIPKVRCFPRRICLAHSGAWSASCCSPCVLHSWALT